MKPIYLDYNATTPIDPAVRDAMLPFLGEQFGNPSSAHAYGQAAHAAIVTARRQVADLIGAQPDEIVFTGGGTEASNHAIVGAVLAKLRGPDGQAFLDAHVVTTAVEHPATLQPAGFLKRLGCRVTIVGVDGHGVVDLDVLRKAIDQRTTLVSVMHSNNEVGTLQPIREIAALAHEHGALMHTDAAQSLGKVKVDVNELGVDLLSVAGHKLYAPKGIGVLYVRNGVRLEPLIHGASQEHGRRAGTENVPYIVALGAACEIAGKSFPAATTRLCLLRDRLWERLRSKLGDNVVLNGHPDERLPNTLNVNFVGQIGADVLRKVPEVAASVGSACHESDQQRHFTLSPVLTAMGIPVSLGKGAMRLSVGRFTTENDVDRAAELLSGHIRGKEVD